MIRFCMVRERFLQFVRTAAPSESPSQSILRLPYLTQLFLDRRYSQFVEAAAPSASMCPSIQVMLHVKIYAAGEMPSTDEAHSRGEE